MTPPRRLPAVSLLALAVAGCASVASTTADVPTADAVASLDAPVVTPDDVAFTRAEAGVESGVRDAVVSVRPDVGVDVAVRDVVCTGACGACFGTCPSGYACSGSGGDGAGFECHLTEQACVYDDDAGGASCAGDRHGPCAAGETCVRRNTGEYACRPLRALGCFSICSTNAECMGCATPALVGFSYCCSSSTEGVCFQQMGPCGVPPGADAEVPAMSGCEP